MNRLDAKDREAMILRYAPLVKRIAAKMAVRLPASVAFDELISAGSVGLIDAIDKYNPDREVSLETYAAYRIRGAILDELRSMDWYSRSMRKKIRDIERAVNQVESRLGRSAEDEEVAEALGIDLDQYYKDLTDIHSAAMLSLDEYIRNQDNEALSRRTFQDRIRSEDDPVGNFGKEELKKVVAKAIRNLSQKEQYVVSMYYHDELTLNEIGKVLSLTESRICQIHTAALIKLRNKLKTYYQTQ